MKPGVRQDIRELNDTELSDGVDALSTFFREEMAAPRTAEMLAEAAQRLRGTK